MTKQKKRFIKREYINYYLRERLLSTKRYTLRDIIRLVRINAKGA